MSILAAKPLAEGIGNAATHGSGTLERFSERELSLMRSPIFARHGCVFNTDEFDTSRYQFELRDTQLGAGGAGYLFLKNRKSLLVPPRGVKKCVSSSNA